MVNYTEKERKNGESKQVESEKRGYTTPVICLRRAGNVEDSAFPAYFEIRTDEEGQHEAA